MILIRADQVCDCVPGLSLISNLVDLFLKYVVLPRMDAETIQASRYYQHLASKSVLSCVVVGFFGGLARFCFWIFDKPSDAQVMHVDAPTPTPKEGSRQATANELCNKIDQNEDIYTLLRDGENKQFWCQGPVIESLKKRYIHSEAGAAAALYDLVDALKMRSQQHTIAQLLDAASLASAYIKMKKENRLNRHCMVLLAHENGIHPAFLRAVRELDSQDIVPEVVSDSEMGNLLLECNLQKTIQRIQQGALIWKNPTAAPIHGAIQSTPSAMSTLIPLILGEWRKNGWCLKAERQTISLLDSAEIHDNSTEDIMLNAIEQLEEDKRSALLALMGAIENQPSWVEGLVQHFKLPSAQDQLKQQLQKGFEAAISHLRPLEAQFLAVQREFLEMVAEEVSYCIQQDPSRFKVLLKVAENNLLIGRVVWKVCRAPFKLQFLDRLSEDECQQVLPICKKLLFESNPRCWVSLETQWEVAKQQKDNFFYVLNQRLKKLPVHASQNSAITASSGSASSAAPVS